MAATPVTDDHLATAGRAWITVDLDAIRDNVATLAACAPNAATMAVVKADAYGHGLLPVARAALAGGATWLGTALIQECLELRAAGIEVPLLAWLWAPGDPRVPAAVASGVDLSVATPLQVAQVAAAARAAGRPARVHLKIDTGLSRGGATAADWPDLVAAVAPLAAEGVLVPMGAWSHFAFADEPEHPVNLAQVGRLVDAADVARRMGVPLPLRHLANSAAVLTRPEAHLELVRPGVSVYGLSPVPDLGGPEAFGLRPAMTLTARAALVKRVPAGSGVSYSHRYTTTRETSLLLVPLGYADGIPRAASSQGPVLAAGAVRRVAGRVCMDQFVLDIGDDAAAAGDPVVLFGPGDAGEPTAQDWADAADTIHYEITTRLGVRVPRVYVGTAGRTLGDEGSAAAEGGR